MGHIVLDGPMHTTDPQCTHTTRKGSRCSARYAFLVSSSEKLCQLHAKHCAKQRPELLVRFPSLTRSRRSLESGARDSLKRLLERERDDLALKVGRITNALKHLEEDKVFGHFRAVGVRLNQRIHGPEGTPEDVVEWVPDKVEERAAGGYIVTMVNRAGVVVAKIHLDASEAVIHWEPL